MSTADNARSFWVSKDRSESPTGPLRPREGRTMEGLRYSLEKAGSSPGVHRALPVKPIEASGRLVRNSVFLEKDRSPSPATSPTFGRKSPFAKDISSEKDRASASTSPVLPRSVSPFKSSFASPEAALHGTLFRSKSVTFNESLEVRHMSDCSFEGESSPISAACSLDEERRHSIEVSSDAEGSDYDSDLETLDELSAASNASSVHVIRRALPVIPGARPLPTVPLRLETSAENRVKATVQEESRRNISGLGLHLSSNASFHTAEQGVDSPPGNSTNTYNSGKKTGETTDHLPSNCADRSLARPDDSESKTGQAFLVQNGSSSATKVPQIESRAGVRSPEPAITRENVKEKLAQRKAAKEIARKEQELALRPNDSLAPPLPHYDSFIKLDETPAIAAACPDSPLSDASDAMGPQRKVSDNLRPVTPIEQITTVPEKPQSGRALHHEREKRLSVDLSQGRPSPKSGFTAISYDGDDYGNSDEDDDIRSQDDLVVHDQKLESERPMLKAAETLESDVPSKCYEGKEDQDIAKAIESPLQFLPEIPELPVHNEIAESPPSTPVLKTFDMRHLSLSLDFNNIGSDSLGLEQYMTPEKHPETPITSRTVASTSPIKSDSSSLLDAWDSTTNGHNKENSNAEPATITARGTKLRTRPSLTPADANMLAARRRQVSLELSTVPDEANRSLVVENCSSELHDTGVKPNEQVAHEDDVLAHIQPMAMPVLEPLSHEMSFSDINNAFDRVMQKQKKGYVIRQQTRVVHATAHHEDAGLTQGQGQEDGAKGHTRQSSSVYTTLSQMSGKSSEVGREHRRQGSKIPVGVQMSPRPRAMTNDSLQTSCMVDKLDGGRLFIRVMHVKNLSLPIPRGEEAYFTCTLDNGKHCVTTPKHVLGVNTKINQEFELIADHDLEFILTLQAQYVPPTVPARPKSTLGRLLNSPKKHKPTGSITSLSLAGSVSDSGSFARAHLALKHFRNKAFGRPYTMLVPVLNEWAVETTGMSNKGVPQTRVRKPYKIGNIELQVLYVPPVEAEHRHALPTSLSQAVRDVRDAEWHNQVHCEGYLSQQGGDCPYWRRRQFKLVGPKLTAFHANTGQVRASINLAKAIQVTDDKESLIAPEVTIGKGEHKTRRKSGFAEREEGHLYVAEGFRVRFANGELIDFYADSLEEKDRWMKILRGIVQKIPIAKAWCQTVLEFEASRANVRK